MQFRRSPVVLAAGLFVVVHTVLPSFASTSSASTVTRKYAATFNSWLMLGPYTLRSHFPIAPLLKPAASSKSVRLRPCSLQNWSIFETFTSNSPFWA
nr:MAG TPA: hypothetical protein [Caudoviricetes sp.]